MVRGVGTVKYISGRYLEQLTRDDVSAPFPALSRKRALLKVLASLGVAAAAVACEAPEPILDLFEPPTRPSEAYRAQLETAGLLDAPLGRRWLEAGESALARPAGVTLPHREVAFFEPSAPEASAYRMALRRGEQLDIRIRWEPADGSQVFLDLYEVPRDSTRPLRLMPRELVLDSAQAVDSFAFEPRRDRDYVLLVRPPLLAEGRFELRLSRAPTLAFPVDGHDTGAIRSVFGDPRDGGRRDHHGVDIFAPRGTPALAGVEGTVSRVDTTRLGGRVVWLRDRARSQSLYYAHLDRPLVRRGDRVQPGDTVGLIGNTGNARTTPPHLHFGIYRRGQGPLDPAPFLAPADTATRDPRPLADGIAWRRTDRPSVVLRTGASSRAAAADTLEAWTPFRVVAATNRWLGVRLPDGRRGYVPRDRTESVEDPVARTALAGQERIYAAPDVASPVRPAPDPGASLPVLGRLGPFDWVELPEGGRGWMDAGGSR